MPPPEELTSAGQVAVVGASGFVGRAVVRALVDHGSRTTAIRAPRLSPLSPREMTEALSGADDVVSALATELQGHDVLVNAAGRSEAASSDLAGLLAANALLPGVLARATKMAEVPRFVHISSGAVQGDAAVLDSSARVQPFSAYSYSKAVGEQMALRYHPGTAVYRPAGVQGIERHASRNLVRMASSRLATTAGSGDGNSPQALVDNVADAAAFLALTARTPPLIVHHPSEGIRVGELLELLGADTPRRIPVWLAHGVINAVSVSARLVPSFAARRRRLEVMWFGQAQAASWLTEAGWKPAAGKESWRALGEALR